MYRAEPATHTDPSVSLYYFLSEPDCPPRIPGRGELRAESCLLAVTGSPSHSGHTATVVCCLQLSSTKPGRQQERMRAEPIIRQVTQETRAMVTERQNKIWSLTFYNTKSISIPSSQFLSTEAGSD